MKNNLLASSLMVVISLLLLVAALQMFGWGRGMESLEAEPFNGTQLNKLQVSESTGSAIKIDDKVIVQITDTPLFSADRKPFVPEETLAGLTEDEPEVVADPLKAKVTSIIITDENSYAMVFDELSNTNVTLEQGMPLPGDQGLWVLDEIKPRLVTFVAEGEETVELGLDIFDGLLNSKAPRSKNNNRNKNKKNTRNNNNNSKNDNTKNNSTQKNSAEEIRKKIAERRAQMRANAAKGNKE